MTKDLTKGSPMRLILSFGIPLLFGYLFQQLYNVVDTAIVGKTLGGAALAAVGATGSINFLVVGFCAGICGGFAIPVAQQFGAGDQQELRRYVTGGTWLCVLFGAALTAATQNVEECLRSETARLMFANSEFLVLLNQAATDRAELAKLLNISENQMGYVTNAEAGHGLLRVGGAIVPFANEFPRTGALYQLWNTTPTDK